MAIDYSKMLADEKDTKKQEIMKKQFDAAGIKYTIPTTPTREQLLSTQPAQSTPQPIPQTGRLINYYDKAGNLQQLDESYAKSGQVPSGWTTTAPITQQPTQLGVADQILKNRQESERLAQEAYNRQIESAKTGLATERQQGLTLLGRQKAEIEPRIAQQRASAVSGTTIAQKRLADLIPFSGTMAGTQVQRGEELNTGLQQRQSELDVAKQTQYSDIANKEQDLESAYQSGLRQAESTGQASLASQLSDIQRNYANQSVEEIARQEGISREDAQIAKADADKKLSVEKEDFLTNINQYAGNFQAEIENLKSQGIADNDYRLQALRTARVGKLASMAEAQQEAEIARIKDEEEKQQQAFELAKWRFDNGLPATKLDSQLLGVPVGQVSPAQVIKQAELALAKQKEARVASGKSSGSSSSGSGAKSANGTPTKPIVTTATLRSQIDKNVTTEIASRGLLDNATTMNQLRADQIIRYSENGQLTDKQAAELIATYGLTQSEIEQAERRLNLVRGLGGQ